MQGDLKVDQILPYAIMQITFNKLSVFTNVKLKLFELFLFEDPKINKSNF